MIRAFVTCGFALVVMIGIDWVILHGILFGEVTTIGTGFVDTLLAGVI